MSSKNSHSPNVEKICTTPWVMDTGTVLIRSKTRERNEQLLSTARESVNQCLQEQREFANQEPRIQKFRQLNPHTQREYMEEKPARLFYYLERAFSLPEDYMELSEKTSRNTEKELLESIVLHPEFFTDDFLVGLGICEKYDFYRKSIHKKLGRRVEAISRIKEAFAHTEHLPFGARGKTARIVSFKQPGEPWHGKYILFQERTGLMEVDGVKRKMTKVIPHVFDNIFSLARSQEKAIDAMAGRSEKMESLKEKIDSLLLRWYDLADEERRNEIIKLREELQGKQTFHEISALQWHIEKIDFSNTQISTGRLIGAWNDLMRSYAEKMGKSGTLFEQAWMLRSMIRTEMHRFEIVYQKFLALFESFEYADLEKSVKRDREDGRNDITLSPSVREQFHSILPSLREYIGFYSRQPFVGSPFVQIHNTIKDVYDSLRGEKYEKYNDKTIVYDVLMTTLHLTLYRIRIGFYDIKDRIKSAHMQPSEEDREYIRESIGSLKGDIWKFHILSISTGKLNSMKFTAYSLILQNIKREFEEGNMKEVLKQIDDMIVPII